MSLFGSLMGDFEDDPFFRSHMMSMQRMNSMMNSMFANPFGMMETPALMDSRHPQNAIGGMPGMQMMPFGFPPMPTLSMGRLFNDLGNMGQNPNCQTYSSSSIMTMTSGPDGRPQVYQETMSTRTAPGGVKETKKTVSDSRSGVRKMAIGHHIGERAHILEREQNYRSGDREERQEFINLEEEEADEFNKEWETKSKRSLPAIAGSPYRSHNPYNRSQQENKPLALPSTAPSSSRQSKNHSRSIASSRRAIRPALSSRPNKTNSTPRSAESTSTSTSISSNPSVAATAAASTESPENLSTMSRKRERTPDSEDDVQEISNKRLSTSPGTSQRAPQDLSSSP